MNTRRMLSAALGVATIVAMNGCSSLCGAREQRAVTLGAGIDGLTPYDLKQSNQAEAAFTIAKYSFPPPTFTVNFRAVTSTGTIRVTDRDDGSAEFTLNLSFTDANGKTTLVTGNVQAVTERYTPPCIS